MGPQFAGEPPEGPQKGFRLRQSPLPISHEPRLRSWLTEALGHKLRVDDVVRRMVGLHYMEAAVAPAVEKP